jgi:uncharacterized protein YdhG (YjbR/CyaY superfamily)
MPRPKSVAEYIATAPAPLRKRLREMRTLVRAAAPGATETLKWGSPAYSYRRVLVMFAYFQAHLSLFPTPAVIRHFAKELAKFSTTSATIHFPHGRPLPRALITRIVKFRAQDERANDTKWRTSTR